MQTSKGSLPVESHKIYLILPATSCDNTRKMLATKKLLRDSVPKLFTGGWWCKHTLHSMYQDSRLPEGKQVFSINYIVCTDSLGRHSEPLLSVLGRVRNPSSQMPASSTLQAGFPKDNSLRPAVITLLHTWAHEYTNIQDMKQRQYVAHKTKNIYYLTHYRKSLLVARL